MKGSILLAKSAAQEPLGLFSTLQTVREVPVTEVMDASDAMRKLEEDRYALLLMYHRLPVTRIGNPVHERFKHLSGNKMAEEYAALNLVTFAHNSYGNSMPVVVFSYMERALNPRTFTEIGAKYEHITRETIDEFTRNVAKNTQDSFSRWQSFISKMEEYKLLIFSALEARLNMAEGALKSDTPIHEIIGSLSGNDMYYLIRGLDTALNSYLPEHIFRNAKTPKEIIEYILKHPDGSQLSQFRGFSLPMDF